MDELLGKLTPAEFWVWGWLSSQSSKGKSKIISIGPGLGPALYSRKQLTRILRGLEVKKFLIIDHLPKNQNENLVMVLAESCRLDIFDSAPGQECLAGGPKEGFEPGKRFAGPSMSRQRLRGNGDGTKAAGCAETPMSRPEDSASASARSLKTKASAGMGLEDLLELSQENLMRAVMAMTGESIISLEGALASIAPNPRGKRSRRAKVYARLRFLQSDGNGKENPAAWVETVAKRVDYQMERLAWKDDRSGSAGKSLSPGKCAER